jgi:hypothetical protein
LVVPAQSLSMARRKPLTSHSSGRLRRRLIQALGGRAFSCVVPRAFHVSASCWQSGVCRSWLACVVVFRALGRLSRLARVGAHRLFVLCPARGSSQRGVRHQRFALRAQATSFVALPGIQSSVIVLAGDGASCCRLTSRSRRTAAPPLNSSVRCHGNIPRHCSIFRRVMVPHIGRHMGPRSRFCGSVASSAATIRRCPRERPAPQASTLVKLLVSVSRSWQCRRQIHLHQRLLQRS